jgi:hypothetical protein
MGVQNFPPNAFECVLTAHQSRLHVALIVSNALGMNILETKNGKYLKK